MKYKKYYDLIKEQVEIFDKTQNCKIGQTWDYHLLPVIKNALMLADKYGADKDIVEVSAIFHDYADLLDFANRENHHILGAELAEGVLMQDGFSQDFIPPPTNTPRSLKGHGFDETGKKRPSCQ